MKKKVKIKELPSKMKVVKELSVKRESLEEEVVESELKSFRETISGESEAVAPVLPQTQAQRGENAREPRAQESAGRAEEGEVTGFQYRSTAQQDTASYKSQVQSQERSFVPAPQRNIDIASRASISSVLNEREIFPEARIRNPDDVFRAPSSQDLNAQQEQRYEATDTNIRERKRRTDFF